MDLFAMIRNRYCDTRKATRTLEEELRLVKVKKYLQENIIKFDGVRVDDAAGSCSICLEGYMANDEVN